MQVSFYTDAVDPLLFACRLIRRARGSGRPLSVVGPRALLIRLDLNLWGFEPAAFVPHRLGEAKGPDEVGLVEAVDAVGHRALLLNLGLEVPQGANEFERVLEVVGCEPEQVQAGRLRYRAYKGLGAQLSHVSAAG